MTKSRSQQALDWIEADPDNRSLYKAAKEFNLAYSTVLRAHKRRTDGRERCPHCGQVLPAKS